MSTTVYLQCLAHDPPLQSDEVGQHLYNLDDVRQWIADRKLLVDCVKKDYHLDGGNPNWLYTTAWFLYHHQECDIGIIDEYGNEHPIVKPDDKG